MAALTQLTKKAQKWNWSPEAAEAFRDIKNCLVSAPILTCPNFEYPFTIQTDGSQVGLGAVLTQTVNGEEKVIAYASRTLTAQEQKYTTTEIECLAVVFAVESFRPYVEGAEFSVITDHHSLLWLYDLTQLEDWPDGHCDYKIIILIYSIEKLSEELSRAPLRISAVNITIQDHDRWYTKMIQNIHNTSDKYPRWRTDGETIYKLIDTTELDYDSGNEWKKVVPKTLRKQILEENHDMPSAGHLGIFKTTIHIASQFYWPNMTADVIRYVRKCNVCLAHKADQNAPAGKLGHRIPIRAGQILSTDLMGPFPLSSRRNRFLLVVVDNFTKFVLMYPLTQATGTKIVRLLEDHVFTVFGVPQYLIADNGPQYVGKEVQKFLEKYNCKLLKTPYYHAQANPTERANRVIKTMISSYIQGNHRKWDENLPQLGFALRTAVHETTEYTPAYLMFGRELYISGKQYREMYNKKVFNPLAPLNYELLSEHLRSLPGIFHDVQTKLDKAYAKAANRYNLRRREFQLEPGQTVWKKNYVFSDAANYFSAKLAPKCTKCRVLSKLSDNVYKLQSFENDTYLGNWHVKDIKLNCTDDE